MKYTNIWQKPFSNKSVKKVFLLLIVMLCLSWYLGGMLAVGFLGLKPGISLYNLSSIWCAGFPGIAGFSFVLLFVIAISCFGFYLGNIYRFIAENIFMIVVSAAATMSLSLALYNSLHHSNMPLWPWDWYHIVVLNSFSISNSASLWGFSILFGMLMLFIYFWIYINPHSNKLGNAHFASVVEVYKSQLFNKTGMVIAKAYNEILRVKGHEGMLVVAPMGSGKTTAVAIPNLLEWEGSVVINDLKGELWEKTAEFRKQHLANACYNWSPSEPDSQHRQNPFFYVSPNPEYWYRDLQLIAQSLIPSGKQEQNFWLQSSRDLFLFLAMYLFTTKKMATLSEIYRLAKQPNFVAWLTEVIAEGEDSYPAVLMQNAYALLNADHETRSNMLQDFYARITLFGDPIIQRNTDHNDFDIRNIRRIKMSIYINIPEREQDRLSPLLTLFWAQFIDNVTIKEPNPQEEPYSVLAILDEFGALAKIEKLKRGASFLRSFHVILMIIVQYLGQIESVYGKVDARSFLNMKVKMTFTLNDDADAKYFSDCIGQTTVKMRSRNISNHRGGGGVAINHHDQLRPLMRPEEIMRMPKDNALILIEGGYPIQAKKCFYFKERRYKALLQKQSMLKGAK